MEHKGTVRLETERLILRRFMIDDAEAMFRNWCSDDEVTKFLMWTTHTDVEETRETLKEWEENYAKDDNYLWAITLKENGDEVLGSISAVEVDDKIDKIHIGYCLSRKYWHQGIMSEALAALVRFFFEEVKANRIESRHDPRNPNSGKVMMKCGLKFEGTLRQNDWNNQGICDESVYGLLKSEWES